MKRRILVEEYSVNNGYIYGNITVEVPERTFNAAAEYGCPLGGHVSRTELETDRAEVTDYEFYLTEVNSDGAETDRGEWNPDAEQLVALRTWAVERI